MVSIKSRCTAHIARPRAAIPPQAAYSKHYKKVHLDRINLYIFNILVCKNAMMHYSIFKYMLKCHENVIVRASGLRMHASGVLLRYQRSLNKYDNLNYYHQKSHTWRYRLVDHHGDNNGMTTSCQISMQGPRMPISYVNLSGDTRLFNIFRINGFW